MRGEFDGIDFGENSVGLFYPLFLVFYLTRDRIFVNRLGLPATFRDLQAAVNWPEHYT